MTDALIEAHELFELMHAPRIGQGRLRILDASFAMPGATESPYDAFLIGHIESARFFDVDAISDQNNPLPHMLPSSEQFERQIGALGIGNTDTIIIYGQSGIIMGPARAWWMFRVFGHDNVRILNGGLPAWKAAGFALQPAMPEPATPALFKAKYRPALVSHRADIEKAIDTGLCALLDARSPERFAGTAPEPRPGLIPGHMPGALNLPAGKLVDPATGKLLSEEQIRKALEAIHFDPAQPVITTCGSGVTACVIVLALHTLGYTQIPVYDGSWSEWGQDNTNNKISQSN